MATYTKEQSRAAKAISSAFGGSEPEKEPEEDEEELEDKRTLAQRITDALKSQMGK